MNPTGCSNLTSVYRQGKSVKKDYPKAIKIYKKSCNLNSGLGCIMRVFLGNKLKSLDI